MIVDFHSHTRESDGALAPEELVDMMRARGATLSFVERQVLSSRNVTSHPVWDFLFGGLNYQIEHHLFPKTCHIHYPALSPIVEATCRAHGISHQSHPTMRRALRSHIRWLKRMGRKVDRPDPAPQPA